ncbi:neutral zinc metallopeptidase [Rhodoblastus acidophilus]|uniref:Neutral zinc metallopeptidase n=1 Tax=Candidatus Rhodoblastus alkanivorans TaxID=2954117 RepID=A0ABS9ZA42_9HYPH|nr:neutral zinc metallopeptidase [Candidatus Rhodoblastus alkanivorans]MCI4677078.1 neutral zinc metallopeptidase [Candidatus Rhodoblastus alkanivorans]MCI4684431.1 neutral zinc metallopeptidase [Candidatus Rhodoblastus alkanivorans]MDI4641752.1 neutral zinc metallopeptidase [Rhodoblastus acidophilus]
MKWEDFRQSENIEDRRGDGPMMAGGGGSSGHLGLGAIIVLGLIGYALGIDPRVLIGGAEMVSHMGGRSQQQQAGPQGQRGAPKDQVGRFVAAILAENEDVWSDVLPAQTGVKFKPAPIVLFNGATRSACGVAQSAMGPFYCPLDGKIYLDTSFFRDMKTKFGGGGDFAYAYVISHEMGHHIQDLLGILRKAQAAEQNASSRERANAISVRIELQADCFAGVWAANANQKWQVIEPGDIEKAVATAQAIGDDRLQKASRGYAVPDSFTHGTSAQRVQWLERGLHSGKVKDCNTFAQ